MRQNGFNHKIKCNHSRVVELQKSKKTNQLRIPPQNNYNFVTKKCTY